MNKKIKNTWPAIAVPLAAFLGLMSIAATIDIYLQPELTGTTDTASGDVIAVFKSGGGAGSGRKMKLGNLVPKPADAGEANDVWISARSDGLSGDGSKRNPFNGSGSNLDAVLADSSKAPANTHLHIGPGVFQVGTAHSWAVLSGWDVDGAGMYLTSLQYTGSIGSGVYTMFTAPNSISTDHVRIHNLTIDLNWASLSTTATTGGSGTRTITSNAVSSSATVTLSSGTVTIEDVGRVVSGAGIPAGSWIGVINSSTSFGLSSSAVANTPVTATVSNGATLTIAEKACVTHAIYIPGSYNLFENVRMINSYGSSFNGYEQFGIAAGTPSISESNGNEIRFCRAELPWGSYGAPFSVHGYGFAPNPPYNYSNGASVHGCIAIGRPGGLIAANGFTSGGVNTGWVRRLKIYDNTFIDCFSIVYMDTGFFDGVDVGPNNNLVRGGYGVGFPILGSNYSTMLRNGLHVFGNNINILNKAPGGGVYGVTVTTDGSTQFTDVQVSGNNITYDSSGLGSNSFTPISVLQSTAPRVENNIIPDGSGGVTTFSTSPVIRQNRTQSGNVPIGLEDSERAFYVYDLGGVGNQVPNWATTVVIASPSALTNHMFIKAPENNAFDRFVILDPFGRINGTWNLIVQRNAGDTVINGNVASNLTVGFLPNQQFVVTSNHVNGIVAEKLMTLGYKGGTALKLWKHGQATLTAGTVTVSDTDVTSATRIWPQRHTDGGTVGASYSVTRSGGASFTITSKDGSGATQTADTSVLDYQFIEP